MTGNVQGSAAVSHPDLAEFSNSLLAADIHSSRMALCI